MAKQLDVYREWLGITDTDRPLNHYQLLRIKKFEDDPSRIRKHYRQMNAHVRKYSGGEFAQQSQALLNELAQAMLCLTDLKRKREYDASMGRPDQGDTGRATFEELLLRRKLVDTAQLEKARNFASAVGLETRDAVVQQKLMAADVAMQVYAESQGLPYVELSDVGVSEEMVPKIPAILARQNSCVPVMMHEGLLLMASPNPLGPDVEEELRLRVGASIRTVLCTPSSIHELVNQYYPKEKAAAEMAAGGAAKSGKASDPSSSSPQQASAPPADLAELKKRQKLATLVTFNMAFVAAMIVASVILKMTSYTVSLPLAFVVGGVAAAAAWIATSP